MEEDDHLPEEEEDLPAPSDGVLVEVRLLLLLLGDPGRVGDDEEQLADRSLVSPHPSEEDDVVRLDRAGDCSPNLLGGSMITKSATSTHRMVVEVVSLGELAQQVGVGLVHLEQVAGGTPETKGENAPRTKPAST